MVASHDGEEPFGVRPSPLLDVLDPGAVNAKRHIVLGLARNRTGVATDTARLVDDESVFQNLAPSIARRTT